MMERLADHICSGAAVALSLSGSFVKVGVLRSILRTSTTVADRNSLTPTVITTFNQGE
ncbi:hypothetical protein Plhal304r1_c029g0096791 [Plasmopara halstedii]